MCSSDLRQNAGRKARRQQRTLEREAAEWFEAVEYMHCQIKRLKEAYQGSVLSVYKTRDPEENENISYEDKDRDRLTVYQEKRLRQQCLAVRFFYEKIIHNGHNYNKELCAQAAANHSGVERTKVNFVEIKGQIPN